MTEQATEKTFKLPKEVRNYHKLKEREKEAKLGHPWICSRCETAPVKDEPLYKNMETKQKLCSNCVAREIMLRRKEEEST